MASISFRPLTVEDFPVLVEWFAEPAVAKWWGQPGDLASVATKYRPRIEGRVATSMWIVVIDEEPGGLLQFYQHRDHPDHDARVGVTDAVGVDYLLGNRHRGRGLASKVLREFAGLAFDRNPTMTACVATPAQANEPSCRALERAGFVRRGVSEPPDEPPEFIYVFDRPVSDPPASIPG